MAAVQQQLFTDYPITPLKSVKKQRTELFYTAVKDEYHKLINIKKNGVRLYSSEYILAELSKKFFRSPRTIENILFNRV